MRPWTIWHTLGQMWIAGAVAIAFASNGDPQASGIVEDGLGGPGDAFLIGLLVIAIPAVVVAVADGRLARRRTTARAAARALLVLALAFAGGMLVITAAAMDCDGTCIDPPTGVILASLAAAEIGVLGSWVVGRGVARIGPRPR